MDTPSTQELIQKIVDRILRYEIVFLDKERTKNITDRLSGIGYSDSEIQRWWNAFYTYWISDVSIQVDRGMDTRQKEVLIQLFTEKGEAGYLEYTREHPELISMNASQTRKIIEEVGEQTLEYFLKKTFGYE